MKGYPTAWFVDAAGRRIGPLSIEEAGLPTTEVSLRPGDQASTTVWYDNPQVPYPPCQTATTAGIRVVPPGQTKSVLVNVAVTICSPNYPLVGTTPMTADTTPSLF